MSPVTFFWCTSLALFFVGRVWKSVTKTCFGVICVQSFFV